jgi:hypothetical protein
MSTELLRLAWTDLRATWLSWVAVAATLVASATGCAFSLAFLVTGSDDAGELGGVVLGFALIGVVSGVTAVTGLVVNERRRTYARWKLLGLPGPGVFTVVLLQVLLVAVVASVPGAFLAVPLVPPAADYFATQDATLGEPRVTALVVGIAVAVCVAAALVGVLGRAWKVARVRPVAALRAAVVPKERPGIVATGTGLLFGVSAVAIGFSEEVAEDGGVLALQMMVLLTMVPLTGWFLPLVLQWTRVLRFLGVSARTAADSVRVRTAFTCAQVLPWFLVAGSVVGVGSPMMVLVHAEGGHVDGLGVAAVMFAPAVLPPLVAGLASVLVMRPRHVSDAVVLFRAGATRGQRRAVAWWESAAVVVSAGILTLLLTVPGVVAANHIYRGAFLPDGWWRDILWTPLAVILAVMWVLVAAVTVGTSRVRLERAESTGRAAQSSRSRRAVMAR